MVQKSHGQAIGGPYLSVHLRRRDYLFARKGEVPTIEDAAKQIKAVLNTSKLQKVFVSTDAPDTEFESFKKQFDDTISVFRFTPTKEMHEKYKDGGVAIIDQWIAAHGRVFVGSHISTFSFRINEEREIMGFEQKTTFNRLCGGDTDDCEQPTSWSVLY